MSDVAQANLVIQRQKQALKRQETEIHELRIQVAQLRSERDHAARAGALVPSAYAYALTCLWHVAHYGLPPGESAGIGKAKKLSSKAPIYDQVVYRKLTRELERLVKRAEDLTTWLGSHDDGTLDRHRAAAASFERESPTNEEAA